MNREERVGCLEALTLFFAINNKIDVETGSSRDNLLASQCVTEIETVLLQGAI